MSVYIMTRGELGRQGRVVAVYRDYSRAWSAARFAAICEGFKVEECHPKYSEGRSIWGEHSEEWFEVREHSVH